MTNERNTQLTALESVIESLIAGNDTNIIKLIKLLNFLNEHRVDLDDLQTMLTLSYFNFKKGEDDTLSTHL